MKNLFKHISLTLAVLVCFGVISPAIHANAYTSVLSLSKLSINQDNDKIPDLILSPEDIIRANEYIKEQIEKGNKVRLPRSVGALAGTFLIPGVGEVVITAAGVIIVGGAVVAAGSWLADKITDWVTNYKFNKSAEKAVDRAGNDSNKVHHIMDPKHNWNKYSKDPNDPKWKEVAAFILRALKEGSEEWETGNVYLKTLELWGETIQVRFIKDADGFIDRISTAWVK